MYEQSLTFFTTLLDRDFTNYCNRQLAETGPLQEQLYSILYVGKHPGCVFKELTKGLRMDIGHTTRSLVKPERGGFLEREFSSDDRRAHILRLTEGGEAAFHLSHELFVQWNEMVLGGSMAEGREQLVGLLRKALHMEGGMPYVRNNIRSH